jgi:ATP-dependent DNA helicase RecG
VTTTIIETLDDLKARVAAGEDGKAQFKADVRNTAGLAAEMVAFANSRGGVLLIGVTDEGRLEGLASEDVRRVNQLVSAASSENVRPGMNPETDNILLENGRVVVVVRITEGVSKPYMDSAGAIWVKNGSDKRRVTAREEMQRIFQASGLLHADETGVPGTGPEDIDREVFSQFYGKRYDAEFDASRIDLAPVLRNMNLLQGERLNLAGALLFGKNLAPRLPAFVTKAVAFPGTEITDTSYLDSRELTGTIPEMYTRSISFVAAHLVRVQGTQGFNSIGEPEIPMVVFEELIANALIHRDYFISAPVRLLVFRDRIEIVSPGHLPNNLTLENIKAGNSNIRNPILASFATYMLPYRGLGSGIVRALRAWPDIDFVDDRDGNLFKAIVRRKASA